MRDGEASTGPRRLAGLVVVAVYTALSLVAQRTLVPGLSHDVYAQAMLGNDCLLHVWTLAWDHHALVTQPCALFDANIFHPHAHTLLYSDHLLGLALLLVPLRLLTGDALLVHNLVTLAAPALDALAAYALAYELGRRRAAAFVAGLVYGFAPMRFGPDRCQIQMLAAWWLPMILLFARRAILHGRRRDALAAGAALALQGLSGIYLTAYFLPFLALAHVLWWRRYPLAAYRRGWLQLMLAEIAAAAVLLPSSLAYRAVQAELGTSRALYTNALLSLQLGSLSEYVPVTTLATLAVCALVLWRRLPRDLRLEMPLFVALALGGLVLALGPVLPVPAGGAVPGPYRLLLLVPGFDALRAPGRLVHVGLLGAALLAAGAIAALGSATTRWGRVALVAGVLGALAIESVPSEEMPTLRVPARAAEAPVFDWLARHRTHVRALLLPIDPYGLSAAVHQYTTIWHWAPVLNGNTGVMPPVYPFLLREIVRFPDDEVVADLRALGATHVVAHLDRMPALRDGRLAAALARPHPALKRVLAHRAVVVLAIRPRLRPARVSLPARRLDRTRWTVTASHSPGEAALAIDASRETYWRSWSDLESELTRWYQPIPFVERVTAFEASLPVRLEIDFGDTVDLSGLELRLGGTDALLMPNVRVESSLDGTTWQPVPSPLRPFPTVRALVRHPRAGRYGLRFSTLLRARRVRLIGNGLELRVADVEAYVP